MINLENIEKINETISMIEKYSNYLYRKSWSKVLIVWGILLPLTFVLFSQNENLVKIFDVYESFFKYYITSILIIIGLGITIYTFISINKTYLTIFF